MLITAYFQFSMSLVLALALILMWDQWKFIHVTVEAAANKQNTVLFSTTLFMSYDKKSPQKKICHFFRINKIWSRDFSIKSLHFEVWIHSYIFEELKTVGLQKINLHRGNVKGSSTWWKYLWLHTYWKPSMLFIYIYIYIYINYSYY